MQKDKAADINNAKLHNKILEIFKEVKRVCDQNNLRYFAIGGTCIGAVRHKGFIPWDDDLDIAMPNSDYERFLNIADKELPDNLKLLLSHKTETGTLCFAKVHDITTTFIEPFDEQYPDRYKGIYIDIMPMFGTPENKVKQKIYATKIKLCLILNRFKRLPFRYWNNRRPVYSFFKMCLWYLTKLFTIFEKKDFYYKQWYKTVSKYDFDNSKYVGYVWSRNINKLIFRKEWFESTIEVPFEDTSIKIPVGYDLYLKQQFNNYMSLPPKEGRVNTHNGFIKFNESYKFYQQKYQEDKR